MTSNFHHDDLADELVFFINEITICFRSLHHFILANLFFQNEFAFFVSNESSFFASNEFAFFVSNESAFFVSNESEFLVSKKNSIAFTSIKSATFDENDAQLLRALKKSSETNEMTSSTIRSFHSMSTRKRKLLSSLLRQLNQCHALLEKHMKKR